MKRWMLVCFATLSLLMVVAGSVASPAAAAPGGNADNAKACHKGGWETLARTGAASTAFVSEEECVSYGAQGGSLIPRTFPTVSVRMVHVISQGAAYCVPVITATGFPAGATYVANAYFNNMNVPAQQPTITIDANGDWTGSSISLVANRAVNFRFSIDGVSSPVVQYFCQP
jgi:hypothetical protein